MSVPSRRGGGGEYDYIQGGGRAKKEKFAGSLVIYLANWPVKQPANQQLQLVKELAWNARTSKQTLNYIKTPS